MSADVWVKYAPGRWEWETPNGDYYRIEKTGWGYRLTCGEVAWTSTSLAALQIEAEKDELLIRSSPDLPKLGGRREGGPRPHPGMTSPRRGSRATDAAPDARNAQPPSATKGTERSDA